MTLAKRLNDIERRVRAVEEGLGLQEQFTEQVKQALAEEEADDQAEPLRTLDGEVMGGERDQTQSLG